MEVPNFTFHPASSHAHNRFTTTQSYNTGAGTSTSTSTSGDPFNFPSGFRFRPFDEELIHYYLKRKVMNQELPPNRIQEVNLYQYTPQELSYSYRRVGENEWYFFTPRDRKYPNGKRPNRAAGSGYWKATGSDKPIKDKDQTIIGFSKTLVFYDGKQPKGKKTNWIMHEFRVNDPPRPKSNSSDMRLDDWVLCRIYKNVEKSSKCQTKKGQSTPPLPPPPQPQPPHQNNDVFTTTKSVIHNEGQCDLSYSHSVMLQIEMLPALYNHSPPHRLTLHGQQSNCDDGGHGFTYSLIP